MIIGCSKSKFNFRVTGKSVPVDSELEPVTRLRVRLDYLAACLSLRLTLTQGGIGVAAAVALVGTPVTPSQ